MGSQVIFKLAGNDSTTEEVLIRDDATKTYQTVRKNPLRDIISTMEYREVTPSKCEIEWTVEVKPKRCCFTGLGENY